MRTRGVRRKSFGRDEHGGTGRWGRDSRGRDAHLVAQGSVSIAVQVPSGHVDGVGTVGFAIAVVVDVVADLFCIGIDGFFRVVAVGVVGHVASGLVTVDVGDCGASVAIAVGVFVPAQPPMPTPVAA